MGILDFAYQLVRPKGECQSGASPTFKKVPTHIAIIMDGNGRWAKRRGLPRVAGHRVGVEVLRDILKACSEIGVRYLTVYAFSTENWRRPDAEVQFLIQYLQETIDREIDDLDRNGVRLRFLGRIQALSSQAVQKMEEAMRRTEKNEQITLSVMFNYGGRTEIVDAANQLLKKASENGRGNKPVTPVTEEEFSQFLYTSSYPDPDLLIRTGGEERISNYLLWQLAYTELCFTPVLWPDFKRETLFRAIREFEGRERRFGDA